MKSVTLNSHEVATVLDALCLFKNIYEGKDSDCKRTAYMEHFGCDCGEPLVKTKEIEELYEYISASPHMDRFGAAENRELTAARDTIGRMSIELVTTMSTILRLETENSRLKEVAEFWADKAIKSVHPRPILELDKPPKE